MKKNDKATLFWNLTASMLVEANKGALTEQTDRPLGSSVSAVNNILSKSQMLKAVLPSVIGLSPDSTEWDKTVKDYFCSTSVPIPRHGKEFELGFDYDISDVRYEKAITELANVTKRKFSTSEELADYVQGRTKGKFHVPIELRFKYGQAINPFDYVLFIYCEKLKTVANHYTQVENSPEILFYFNTEDELKEAVGKQTDNMLKAMAKFVEIVSDKLELEGVLTLALPNPYDIARYPDFAGRVAKLKEISENSPTHFLAIVNDDNRKTKLMILKYIVAGVLRQLEGSSMIVDANNPSNVIGRDMISAVSYFNDPANAAVITDLKNRYNNK